MLPSSGSAPGAAHAEQADRPTAAGPPLRAARDLSPENAHPVLDAGQDPAQRAAVLDELTRTMPRSTTFEQADAFWEVLVRAPATRMVILSGELDDVPAESLIRMLGHRHPDLPVVSIDARSPDRAVCAHA